MEDETEKNDSHLISAAAFVEGGIQEALDDACSICLEAFCESEPSTVTGCKHEFHLQCILEWCQRSSNCPMCWQAISLKDATSQELLEAVEHERNIRSRPARNPTIFRHPTLGDFELQIPEGANEAELEERIIQHLTAAAAMGRARHIARREGLRTRSTAQGRQQYLVFSTHPNTPQSTPTSSFLPLPHTEQTEDASILTTDGLPSSQSVQDSTSASRLSIAAGNQHGNSPDRRTSPSQSSPHSQDQAGSSELQSFSETIKSRFNAVSGRYKESITKSTRGWKERLFSRNTSIADIGSEVKREVSAGMATVSRMMEGLHTNEHNSGTSTSFVPTSSADSSMSGSGDMRVPETGGNNTISDTNTQTTHTSCSAATSSN